MIGDLKRYNYLYWIMIGRCLGVAIDELNGTLHT